MEPTVEEYDAEKAAVAAAAAAASNGRSMNGNTNGLPLPPDGMYHVSDMTPTPNGGHYEAHLNGGHNGSLADKVSNSSASALSSSSSSESSSTRDQTELLKRQLTQQRRLPASTCV